ncbi:MAG: DUF4397 domain-containing protein [Cryobacterium sp.]|uniref:DUF4397 domain-containing protein n=1 Tax=unclassified Cryobacterium TaxID=2649013 RepID=UPI001A1C996D|nr:MULTISPECIES: DUF4397 domain-containing protein [unclassified Cryobacterium]MCY7405487.1 DUF4397 domain-containing protein [Cryobacterium sp.]MEC5153558.1 hypothetical protein [Cryobacterium sp. CAN_C3]
MRKSIAVGISAGLLVALAGLAPAQAAVPAASAAPGTASVSVLHAIPGLNLDISVDGRVVVDDFKPGTLLGPFTISAGTHTLDISASNPVVLGGSANGSPMAGIALSGSTTVTVTAGRSFTAVAHLSATGIPTATLFNNDTTPLAAGQGRLTVRHVAAAPAVDVLANGAVAVAGLTNPAQAALDLPVGTISAVVAAAGTTAPLLGPADVVIAPRTNTIVYAWGSLADNNLALFVQTVRTRAQARASVSVLHAIPGVVVDVYVDNKRVIDNFEPGTLTRTFRIAAGSYSLAITAADAADASAAVIGPVVLTVASGMNYTAVAHLSETGVSTAALFTNDTSAPGDGQGRLTVRHVAAAPAVDVLANGAPAFTGLTNPNESVLVLPVGTISAAVAAAGTTAALIGPADVTIARSTNTIVYAWGSLADGNLALAVQTVPTK